MVGVAEDVAEARGLDGVWLTAREELPDNLVFWERRGYYRIGQDGPTIELGKTLVAGPRAAPPATTPARSGSGWPSICGPATWWC